MTDRILRPTESSHKVGYSEMHMRRLEEAGLFPERLKINPDGGPYGAAGHLESWVDTYIELVASGATADELRDWVSRLKKAREKRPTLEA